MKTRSPDQIAKTEIVGLARAHSTKAMKTLISLLDDNYAPDIRLRAAQAILDRAHGKPVSALELSNAGGQAITPVIQLTIEGKTHA